VNVKDQGIAKAGRTVPGLEEAGSKSSSTTGRTAGVKFNDADLIGIPSGDHRPQEPCRREPGDPDAQNGRDEDDPAKDATTFINDLVKGS